MDVYSKLGVSKISDFNYNSINLSLRKNYSFRNDISFYNPCLDLLTKYFNENISLNNRYKLVKLLQKKRRISTIGYFYKALIKYKNKTFVSDIFIKELPIIAPNSLYLFSEYNNSINPINSRLNKEIYDYKSNVNVEIFVTYLCSKFEEFNIMPSFCKFYGCYLINMDKCTYSIGEHPDLQMGMSFDNNYRIIEKRDDVYLEAYNMPVYLLAVEKIKYDTYLYKDLITEDILLSIVFQIFCSMITIYNTFNIKHNDLHIGNILLKSTKKEFLYFKIDKKIYKVPTNGYIVKIIDWGRATYNINGFKGNNSIYNVNNECFGQYIFNKIGTSKKNLNTDKNRYSDIVMLSHNLLYEFEFIRNTKLGTFLKNNILSYEGYSLDYTKFSWKIYKEISKYKFNIRPRNILKNKIFSKFTTNNIDNEHIYNVLLK